MRLFYKIVNKPKKCFGTFQVNNTALAESALLNSNNDHGNHHGLPTDGSTEGHTDFNNETIGGSNPEFACPAPETGTNQTAISQDGPFEWSEPIQGLVLGAYFWGYIFTQLPGGRVAEMFSAKWVIWGSVMVNVVFTLLTPVAAQISYIAVLVVRFMEGLGAVRCHLRSVYEQSILWIF